MEGHRLWVAAQLALIVFPQQSSHFGIRAAQPKDKLEQCAIAIADHVSGTRLGLAERDMQGLGPTAHCAAGGTFVAAS